ncbi:hypothetical protein HG536_0B01500 [Torulaspora globosa]|uniref:Rho-GAP domain-containing protein n=1 Tax=Torulaspora globosa TaxID=48254 RepID=A0A7G3ZCQ2_9SACH|nr:uncharacterized protein HG536_0B01500 [Torulaspora globosa]QLL31288.1 hypothetical protein HG536_0B01500 [Torulaspora globosa]
MLHVNVNRIFFKSYSIDPISGHSIYVFDSTFLPEPDEVGDKQIYDMLIDELTDKLIERIPCAPFSLVVFSSGFIQKKISWVYGVKMFSKLPHELRSLLQKTFIVHESFFVRTVYQVLSNAMSIKMLGAYSSQSTKSSEPFSMVHVSNLTELSQLIDITRLRISLNVYLHDYQINDYIELPDGYYSRLSSVGSRQYRQLIFDKIFKRLRLEAVANELIFQKPGSYKKVNILLDVIERNNYVDLSQWDIYSLASVFLHFLRNKSQPLIPIDLVPLPIKDDFQYTFQTFYNIIVHNHYFELLKAIFPLFISILECSDVTKHNKTSLGKALTPTLCKEKMSMMSADRLALGGRFIRNLFEYFPAIVDQLHNRRTAMAASVTSAIEQPQRPTKLTAPVALPPPNIPRARKSSPSRYGDLKSTDASRSSSQQSDNSRAVSSASTFISEGGPILKNRELSISLRVHNDSVTTLTDESTESRSTSPVRTAEAINQMVTDDTADDKSTDNANNKITAEPTNVSSEKYSKIVQFDKDLEKQKQLSNKANLNAKFSLQGYSDIKVGNKVSKLAALYEERLQGLQILNQINKTESHS